MCKPYVSLGTSKKKQTYPGLPESCFEQLPTQRPPLGTFALQLDNDLPMSEMQKNWGVTNFVFQIKRVENYPNFDKSALITRHGLSGC